MAVGQQSQGHAAAMWQRCLASAFRTTLACTIVGTATLFGPQFITRQVAFPAFSYVTAILIVIDASLGDTLRGCWLVLCATVQGICPAILALWLIGPARLTTGTTAAAVTVSAFVVALPENTHLIAKRIALGQIVMVYVIGYIRGADADPIMHPVHVAASTALGAVACVLALLLPYPSLACYEVRENCKLYIENAAERLKLYMKAFTAEDKTLPKGSISQAKSFNSAAKKLLQSIKSKQESIEWERIPVSFLKSCNQKNLEETLQGLETALRGMETALENCSEFPVAILSFSLKNDLITLQEKVLNQVKSVTLGNSIHPQSEEMHNDKSFLPTFYTETVGTIGCKDLPSLFFLFCLKHLQLKSEAIDGRAKQAPCDTWEKKPWLLSMAWTSYNNIKLNRGRLMLALKCSLSLGFAVLLGLMYSKENGFGSGLPVAISLASAREATFRVANVKAQGTVLGSVYGVIACFVFQKYVKLRFISLVPWFIFCSFLRQSQMYGHAGGVCAVIGAALILGRQNFGEPSNFAIARIVETFIGLSCSIMVDVLLQPTRGAVLAKVQLSTCLQAFHECIASTTLDSSTKHSLEDGIKKLKFHTNELGKLIDEAGMEPNFWFLPLNITCYRALKLSLTKIADFLHFTSLALPLLKQELDSNEWKEAESVTNSATDELNLFKEAVRCRIKCLEEVTLVESVAALEKAYEKRQTSSDLEMGDSSKYNYKNVMIQLPELKSETTESNWFFRHLLDEIGRDKKEAMVCLGSVGFCIDGVWKQMPEMEKQMREVVEWENP